MRIKTLAFLSIALCSIHARAADAPRETEGRRAFQAGVILVQDPDGAKYDEALVQFRRAYELTRNWKVLGNIGLCALKLERDGEAIDAYKSYLALGKNEIDAQERTQVEKDLTALTIQAVTLRLDFSDTDVALIDEREARGGANLNKYKSAGKSLEIRVHPGDHRFVAQTSAGSARWETSLAAGATVAHRFELAAASGAVAPPTREQASGGPPVAAYVAAGIGVVGLATGSIFALKTFSERNARNPLCHDGVCTQEGLEHDAAARQDATISTIAFGAGLVGIGVAAWLFFTPKGPPPRITLSKIWISPTVARDRAQIGLVGTW